MCMFQKLYQHLMPSRAVSPEQASYFPKRLWMPWTTVPAQPLLRCVTLGK